MMIEARSSETGRPHPSPVIKSIREKQFIISSGDFQDFSRIASEARNIRERFNSSLLNDAISGEGDVATREVLSRSAPNLTASASQLKANSSCRLPQLHPKCRRTQQIRSPFAADLCDSQLAEVDIWKGVRRKISRCLVPSDSDETSIPGSTTSIDTTESSLIQELYGWKLHDWRREKDWRTHLAHRISKQQEKQSQGREFHKAYRRINHLRTIGFCNSTGGEFISENDKETPPVLATYSREVLSRCLPPMALVTPGARELSLERMGLGDAYGETFANVLYDLPSLTRLNLRDNRLTDVGVQKIVTAICTRKGDDICYLDLSQNKLDSVAANALCEFIKKPSCRLAELHLSGADMDDTETHIFMKALEVNQTLKVLDFSDNIIGGQHEKLQGGIATGGEAIAKALHYNSTIFHLNLSWNRLGRSSGILLGKALEGNHTLQTLNVAYNAIGDAGAQALGHALRDNAGLTSLDISYNDITSQGAIVLAHALERNETLRDVQLNGNSIGTAGGRTLMRSLNFWVVGRVLGLDNCSLDIPLRDENRWKFDPVYPTGEYTLNLGEPYDRAIAFEIFRCAALLPGCKISRCCLDGQNIRLHRSEESISRFGSPRRIVQSEHLRFEQRYTMPRVEAKNWHEDFRRLCLIDESSGSYFVPAEIGQLEVEVQWVPLPLTELSLLNYSGFSHFLELIRGHRDLRKTLITLAGKDLCFTCRQVQSLIRSNAEEGFPLNTQELIDLMVELVPQILDSNMLHNLITINLNASQQQELSDKIGPGLSAFSDCMSGHYCLDISREFDREAAVRLAEWSNWENCDLRIRTGWDAASGGTSQYGRWNNFRNVSFRRVPLRKGLHDGFFKHGLVDKGYGVLEFDFVSLSRPDVADADLSSGGALYTLLPKYLQGHRGGDRSLSHQKLVAPTDDEAASNEQVMKLVKRCRTPDKSHEAVMLDPRKGVSEEDLVSFLKKSYVFPYEWPRVFLKSFLGDIRDGYATLHGHNPCTVVTHLMALKVCHAEFEMTLKVSSNMEPLPATHINGSYFVDFIKMVTARPAADLRAEGIAAFNRCTQNKLAHLHMWITARETRFLEDCKIVRRVPDVENKIFLHVFDVYIEGADLGMSIGIGGTNMGWVPQEQFEPLPGVSITPLETCGLSRAREVRSLLSSTWLTCEMLSHLCMQFPPHMIPDIIVTGYDRITDICNFWKVLDVLNDAQQNAIASRLGWLNILNFDRINRLFDLDLRNADHHRLAEALTDLAIEEPGPNLQGQKFSRHFDPSLHEWIPGWDLPSRWSAKTAADYVTDPGVPNDGHLVFRYCSSEALGCSLLPELRDTHKTRCTFAGVNIGGGFGMYGSIPFGDCEERCFFGTLL